MYIHHKNHKAHVLPSAHSSGLQDGDVPDLATRCLYIRSTFSSDRAVGLEAMDAMGPLESMEHEEMTEVVF